MGYKFQFITLAGFHSLNYSMFNLAHGYARNSMSAFVELQEAEFAAAERGFTAVKHQREVGTGYFDAVTTTIERDASTARSRARPKTSSSSTQARARRLRRGPRRTSRVALKDAAAAGPGTAGALLPAAPPPARRLAPGVYAPAA